jgi:hypothetical protein
LRSAAVWWDLGLQLPLVRGCLPGTGSKPGQQGLRASLVFLVAMLQMRCRESPGNWLKLSQLFWYDRSHAANPLTTSRLLESTLAEAQPKWTFSRGRVDGAAMLRDVDTADLGQTNGRGANGWHQRTPVLWSDVAGCFRRADRLAGSTLGE